MTFRVDLLDGEEILYGEVYSPPKNVEPFALGVSNKAVFFAEKKRFAVRDPWILNRFSFGKILSVAIYREKPYVWWVLSTLLILGSRIWLAGTICGNVRSTFLV